MELIPRDTGVYVRCDCGSRMFVPSESAVKNSVLFCPCGELEKIGLKTLNAIMARCFRSETKKRGGYVKPPKERASQLGSGADKAGRNDWFEKLA